MVNIKIDKLRKFGARDPKEIEARKFFIEIGGISAHEIDDYMKRVMENFKKIPYPDGQINYRFNGILEDEDIYLYSRRGDDKPANIDTCPPDFRILGSDTEIYIPDRSR